jgi:uncharacterized protein
MLKTTSLSQEAKGSSPDYFGLVMFLVGPFLESPDSLSIDCEQSNHNQRVWIRLAFEGMDKGRVFGRGGRNLQAIRQVLQTAALAAGQSLHLDIYESPGEKPNRWEGRDSGGSDRSEGRRRDGDRRSFSRPIGKSRS